MSTVLEDTAFAPAEREDPQEVAEKYALILRNHFNTVLDGLPVFVLILNRCRQLVFANKAVLGFLGVEDARDALGRRPGEVFGCIHACRTPGGCGTTEFCAHCGAVRSILAGILGETDSRECRMLRDDNGVVQALDLEVSSSPLLLEGAESLTLFTVSDISHVNRRKALERVFFHDIKNTAGVLKGVSDILVRKAPEELRDYVELASAAGSRLVSEIDAQRDLLAAEQGDLELQPVRVRAGDVVEGALKVFTGFEAPNGKEVVMEPGPDAELDTDPVLLGRILVNMIKNGLEASVAGDVVTAGWDADRGVVEFRVCNPAVIPVEIQRQIFNRSFSTKGIGRGLGTYGMKLLGERYLGGRVGFESSETRGTQFFIRLPASER